MVKLDDARNPRFNFRDVKESIVGCTEGFGSYTHQARRAVRLLASLETLRTPDMVTRPPTLATADRAFIKRFECGVYPGMVVLVRKETDGTLTLCTGQPIRRAQIKKWETGVILYPKTPQPPG